MARHPDVFPCNACGRPTHINLLDAHPGTPEKRDPNAADWERLECRECYGPDWRPTREADMHPSSEAQRATAEARAAA